jgi:hypothetical protein
VLVLVLVLVVLLVVSIYARECVCERKQDEWREDQSPEKD